MDEQTHETIATSTEKRFSGNTFEYKRNNRKKIIVVLAQTPDKWWSVCPLADEIDAGFQSVRQILMELALKGMVIMDDSSGRAYFKFNKDKAGEDLVKLWMGKKKEEEERNNLSPSHLE